MAMTQEPISLEVRIPCMFDIYFRPVFQGVSTQNMALYGTVPPLEDPGISIACLLSVHFNRQYQWILHKWANPT